METGIYIKDEHDGEEIRRAIQISTFRLDFSVPVSFLPRSADSFAADWSDWLDGRWNPFFAGHLVQAYLKSRAVEVSEIVKLDMALNAFLNSDEAERSLEAGVMLRDAASNARHCRVLKKFTVLSEDVEGGGHAATIFAIQAAEYNLPLFSSLISYLYFEWKSGAHQLPERRFESSEVRFTVDAIGALGGIRELLRKHFGDLDPAACA